MGKYLPSPRQWVADQVTLYESSHGTQGTTYRDLPVIIVTNTGCQTGAMRKTPLMKVATGRSYLLVASRGGAPTHPSWYYNLKANPAVTIQDSNNSYCMTAREIISPEERHLLWPIAVKAYPLYQDYQDTTDRRIPTFLAEPVSLEH